VDEAAEETNVSDRLANVLAVELYKVMEKLLETSAEDQEKRLSYLRQGLREVRLLRRGDHNAMRLQMELQRCEREWEQEDEDNSERLKKAARERLLSLFVSKTSEGAMADLCGGSEYGRWMADMLTRIKFDLPWPETPMPDEAKTSRANHEKAEPTGHTTGLSKTNPTESDPIRPNQT